MNLMDAEVVEAPEVGKEDCDAEELFVGMVELNVGGLLTDLAEVEEGKDGCSVMEEDSGKLKDNDDGRAVE